MPGAGAIHIICLRPWSQVIGATLCLLRGEVRRGREDDGAACSLQRRVQRFGSLAAWFGAEADRPGVGPDIVSDLPASPAAWRHSSTNAATVSRRALSLSDREEISRGVAAAISGSGYLKVHTPH